MRGNVYFDQDPMIEELEWDGKKQKTWIWSIYTEQRDLFLLRDDPTGLMKRDLEFVPFNTGCLESASFKNMFFTLEGKHKNIIVDVIDK